MCVPVDDAAREVERVRAAGRIAIPDDEIDSSIQLVPSRLKVRRRDGAPSREWTGGAREEQRTAAGERIRAWGPATPRRGKSSSKRHRAQRIPTVGSFVERAMTTEESVQRVVDEIGELGDRDPSSYALGNARESSLRAAIQVLARRIVELEERVDPRPSGRQP
jgi:hypothetical protein